MSIIATVRRAAQAFGFCAAFFCVSSITACGSSSPFPSDDELNQLRGLYRISTSPPDGTNAFADSPAAAALGAQLFADRRLSRCGTVSCSTCHAPPAFAPTTRFAQGCNGETARNTPTMLNAGFRNWFYWDGRKDTLWSHALFPLLDVVEMQADPAAVRALLQSDYAAEYQQLFGVAPAAEPDQQRLLANFGKAIEAYLRTLVKVKAPFDDDLQRFLAAAAAGSAESDPAYLGLRTFIRTGRCIICHKGPMLSDGSFHNLGVREDGAPDHGHLDGVAMLRSDVYNAAGPYSDDPASGRARLAALDELTTVDLDGAFKTPSLRNVALTPPYMHNGAYAALTDVVEFYNRGGDPPGTFAGTRAMTIQPLGLSSAEKQALVDLLGTLTGSETPP